MIATWLGWLGTAGTLGAYALLSMGRLDARSWRYAALNFAGGLLGGIACVLFEAWPAAASNLVWAAIGLRSLVITLRRGGEGFSTARLHRPDAAVPAVPAVSSEDAARMQPGDRPTAPLDEQYRHPGGVARGSLVEVERP